MVTHERRFATAAVIGAGMMGSRIAGVLASGGLAVRLADKADEILPAATATAEALARSLAAEHGHPTGKILPTELEDAVTGADLVIEAVAENLQLKQDLFARISAINVDAVLATNTSVLPVGDVAERVVDPSRFVGTHWWNPPDLIPIVEVVLGRKSDPGVAEDLSTLLEELGKIPVLVRRDVPGFVGNRLQHALWREAFALVSEGVADPETVDLVARNTIGLRLAQMGPIENADYVGLDLTRAIHDTVLPALDTASEPNPELSRLIAAGHLGAKSGQGFLAWPPGRRERVAAALAAHIETELSAQRSGTTQASTTHGRNQP